jgi:hypothetical protein
MALEEKLTFSLNIILFNRIDSNQAYFHGFFKRFLYQLQQSGSTMG